MQGSQPPAGDTPDDNVSHASDLGPSPASVDRVLAGFSRLAAKKGKKQLIGWNLISTWAGDRRTGDLEESKWLEYSRRLSYRSSPKQYLQDYVGSADVAIVSTLTQVPDHDKAVEGRRMLKVLVVAYVLVALASAALLVPKLRKRLPFLWLRRLALIWGLVVVGYTVLSPACVYLPSVPAAPVTRRILLGVDEGQLYWLEGTTDRFAFAAGPRYWLTTIHGLCCEGGLEFIPPLRLARMNERELRWELVRSDGRRVPYPPEANGFYLSHSQVIARGGVVLSAGVVGGVERFDATETRKPLDVQRDAYFETLATTDQGLIGIIERDSQRTSGVYNKKRDLVVREFDLTGQAISERRYLLEDWASGPAGTLGRALFVATASGKTFAALVAHTKSVTGFGKVLLFPDSGEPVEVCSFTYDIYLPLSFAVSPDGRYFSTGQAVWRIDGSHVMPLVPTLRMVTWQGSSLVGIRSFPLVGAGLLDRDINIDHMLGWVRTTDPEVVAQRFGSYGRGFGALFENLSFAVRRRPAWHGGIDDSGGADEIARVQIR